MEITENFKVLKESIKNNPYTSNWLNNHLQFNFDRCNIQSNNDYDKNIIANIYLRDQLFFITPYMFKVLSMILLFFNEEFLTLSITIVCLRVIFSLSIMFCVQILAESIYS